MPPPWLSRDRSPVWQKGTADPASYIAASAVGGSGHSSALTSGGFFMTCGHSNISQSRAGREGGRKGAVLYHAAKDEAPLNRGDEMTRGLELKVGPQLKSKRNSSLRFQICVFLFFLKWITKRTPLAQLRKNVPMS